MLYLYWKGLWHRSGRANREESDHTGWADAQQVVEGGRRYKQVLCGWDHCIILGGCLFFLRLCSSGFQDLLRLNPPISDDVIWMHLNFDGFSDETIHVAGFCRQEFSVL